MPGESVIQTMKSFLALFISCALLLPGVADADAAQPLDLLEFEVHGNTVLSNEAIERAVYPYLGPGRAVGDVEKARSALEKAYHDAGYLTVFVDTPEQNVGKGVVRLRVTEGKVERMRVSGAQYTLPSRIRTEVPSAAEGTVPYFPELQQDLATVNRAPGVRVLPVLQAGMTPGTVDVSLNVEDAFPLSAWVGLNNAYSPNTSKLRINGGLRYDNLFQRAHSFSLQYQTSPTDPGETSAISASYVMPFDGYTRYLSLYGVHSESNVAALGDLLTQCNGDILGARLIVPLPVRGGFSHNLSLGFDFKDFKESLTLGASSAIETPIRYWTLVAAYGAKIEDGSGAWQLGASAVLGLRGLGSDDVAFENKRHAATGDFTVLKLDAQREQRLASGWSVLGRANVQLTDQALISNEQFSAGGVGSVRGYLLSEVLGDMGLRGSLELRSPPIAPSAWPAMKRLQPYLFAEGATLKVVDPLPGQTDQYNLASAGVGLQLETRQAFSLDLSLAVPFRNTHNTQADKPRIHFDARLNF